jgi:hypothetical protein
MVLEVPVPDQLAPLAWASGQRSIMTKAHDTASCSHLEPAGIDTLRNWHSKILLEDSYLPLGLTS